MDSGNSSSMQSSSNGDDQDFTSHAHEELNSGFLNSSQFLPTSNSQSSLLSSQLPTFFDNPSPNYLQSQANLNPSSLMNLAVYQSKGPRSEPAGVDPGNQAAATGSNLGQFQCSSSMQNQPVTVSFGDARAPSGSSGPTTVARNPKKRTRASRRAPTTVLTTDTSNFRAMVQEFTGIPEPPFSGSSRRLDLFGFGSLRAMYPTRSSVQRVQPTRHISLTSSSSPSFADNTLLNPIASSTTNVSNLPSNANTYPISASTNTFNFYQHATDLSMPRQPQNMLNMQNPSLNLQSLLQSSVPSSLNVASFGAKSQVSSASPFMNQELVVNTGNANANFSGLQSHAAGLYSGNQDHHLRHYNENYAGAQYSNNSNQNNGASSSDVHRGKNLDNVASRGEGTAEPWLCP